jgi:hypothetical protein
MCCKTLPTFGCHTYIEYCHFLSNVRYIYLLCSDREKAEQVTHSIRTVPLNKQRIVTIVTLHISR